MASLPLCLVTPRDRDIFQALDRCPLTIRQLLKLSALFAYPFTTERRVQERLQRLCAAGRVRRWTYSTAGRGALSYYTLSPLGFRLLHGGDTAARRGLCEPVGVARQAHTQALAETLVHLQLGAHAADVPIEEFRRENALRLQVGDASLFPDAAFVLCPDPETRYSFFVEIDNRSETVWPGATPDSWGRKVQFYERLQDAEDDRFRVLMVTTGSQERLRNMLRCAADAAHNPRRSLVYGITLADLLRAADPVAEACFQNHDGQPVALLRGTSLITYTQLTTAQALVPSPACLRPQPVA